MSISKTKAEMRAIIGQINDALRAGHPPPGHHVDNHMLGAIRLVAKSVGIYHATLRRLLNVAKEEHDIEPNWELWEAPEVEEEEPVLATSDEVRRNIRLQDENTELKRQIKELHREELNGDAIRQIIGGVVAAPVQPPKWLLEITEARGTTQEVPVTIWSDWHVGESVSLTETSGCNEYGLAIFERRAKRLVERTIDLCTNHGPGNYPGAVVNILGDMVSGGLHPELLKTDEEEALPSVLRVRDTLVTCIEHMAAVFGSLYIPCTSGNHGRTTQKPEFKRYTYKNLDWLIYQLLARHFKGRKDIVLDIPDANEVHYRVFGKRYLAMHGDMLGVKGGDGIIGSIGPIIRGEIKVGRQQAVIGKDYDMLLMGHWHQQLWLPRAIVNNSMKGFDEYAKLALRAPPSTPSQALWFEHPLHGITMMRSVYVEDPVGDATVPWVSVFNKEC